LPTIASDVGGIREIVVDGETGIIIPPQNPDALAQAIQRLIADPALAQRMGEAAFERIKATFTLENQARTLTELYRRVARKR
jgi:glycosyltransferase involved in cell wall biosynthesis